MAQMKAVQDYGLFFDFRNYKAIIRIKTDGGDWSELFYLQPEQALYVSDILRSEKPIYFDGTILQAGPESAGEE
jgi:hypothetical protein